MSRCCSSRVSSDHHWRTAPAAVPATGMPAQSVRRLRCNASMGSNPTSSGSASAGEPPGRVPSGSTDQASDSRLRPTALACSSQLGEDRGVATVVGAQLLLLSPAQVVGDQAAKLRGHGRVREQPRDLAALLGHLVLVAGADAVDGGSGSDECFREARECQRRAVQRDGKAISESRRVAQLGAAGRSRRAPPRAGSQPPVTAELVGGARAAGGGSAAPGRQQAHPLGVVRRVGEQAVGLHRLAALRRIDTGSGGLDGGVEERTGTHPGGDQVEVDGHQLEHVGADVGQRGDPGAHGAVGRARREPRAPRPARGRRRRVRRRPPTRRARRHCRRPGAPGLPDRGPRDDGRTVSVGRPSRPQPGLVHSRRDGRAWARRDASGQRRSLAQQRGEEVAVLLDPREHLVGPELQVGRRTAGFDLVPGDGRRHPLLGASAQ